MSLIGSLSTAKAGMAATAARAQTASSNIANVSTTGYVRRESNIGQNGASGATVAGSTRVQDHILLQSRRDSHSHSAGSAITESVLSRALNAFGEPGSSFGVFGAFTQFESDLQTLRSTPESPAAQTITVDSLKGLTQALTGASRDLQSERTQADAKLAADIDQVNGLASDLFGLNGDIRTARASSRDTAALLDQRDQLIDQIATRLPVHVTYQDTGAVSVRTTTGLSLVGLTVNHIEFSPSDRIGPLDVNTDTPGGRLSIPTLQGQPIGPGSGAHALTEGRIAAYLELRDTIIPTQAAALDDFAYDLASAYDAIGEPILLDSGSPVDAAFKTGLSERLTVNPLIDPSKGGEPSRLRDGLAAAAPGAPGNDTLLTQMTDALLPFSDRLGAVISDVSSAAFRATRIHTGNLAREITLTEAESQLSAVDLDYELQSLLAIEQAYSANARVIQTVSDMLDTLTRI